ncbi:Vsp/OspC family lipoprotein (plasmid) [Borreliella garinii]|uniref:Vsp/OspC family lipoprotein n=1 Tax=Borreliella garinii TaxID=29519 RepID=UPI002B4BC733|nr:Vsp/OspC family lipoprotein [Borreliella garinii]WRM49001.1 Vsp/OspC family lipoprotein [Borreliella garinii]
MKKNTLSAILMTLFLFISCNNSGGDTASTNPDESAKGPDLTVISKKITDSNAFVLAVKEVEALLSSVDELAKAIGKKIHENNGLDTLANQNGSLLAGAYAISTLITKKLDGLKGSEGLKAEIAEAKKCSEDFTKKLKEKHTELGVANGGVTDDNAKKAILKANGEKTLGVEELEKLFKSVESLAKSAQEASSNSVKELTNPVVAEALKKP